MSGRIPESELSEADRGRLQRLRRMKLVSLSLLVVAAVVYLATVRVSHAGFWGWVSAGSEAAMVGGLADWFAVTALFKYPLGLRIPHTAIVPTKKDEIAVSLQDFFTENFLTEEIVRDRLATAQVGLRVGEWLRQTEHADRVATEVSKAARAALSRVGDDEVREVLDDVVMPRLTREPVAGLAGSMLDGIVADGAHRGFVDMVGREVLGWLERNPESFKRMVANRAPWWAPDAVNTRIVDWTYQQALLWIDEILADPEHPTRKSVDDLLLRIASDLQHDEGVQGRAEALKERLLLHPQTSASLLSVWGSVRASLVGALEQPDSGLHQRVRRAFVEVGETLVSDEPQRARFDARVADIAGFFVNTYGREVSGVISHTIQRWDGEEASQRIELHVGRDLQFIRINGTVVGCIAGLLIHAVTVLVGQ